MANPKRIKRRERQTESIWSLNPRPNLCVINKTKMTPCKLKPHSQMKTNVTKKTILATDAISKECNNSNLQYKTHLCYPHIWHQMSPRHSKTALSILTSAMSIIIITMRDDPSVHYHHVRSTIIIITRYDHHHYPLAVGLPATVLELANTDLFWLPRIPKLIETSIKHFSVTHYKYPQPSSPSQVFILHSSSL